MDPLILAGLPLLPVAFVLVLAVGALAACGGGDGGGGGGGSRTAGRVVPGAPVLEVTADNLSFSPDELTVPAGDFTVALTSVDQFHDFVIEDVDGVV